MYPLKDIESSNEPDLAMSHMIDGLLMPCIKIIRKYISKNPNAKLTEVLNTGFFFFCVFVCLGIFVFQNIRGDHGGYRVLVNHILLAHYV